jgi:VWFA-related protein
MASRGVFARSLVLLLILLSTQLEALGDDFGMIVGNVEKHYKAKKKKIPFLGLAGLAVKIVRPAGVKSFKLAVFEDQDFAPGQRDQAFGQAVSKSLNSKWKPMVRSVNRASGARSYVYTHHSGKDMEMLTVTFSSRHAIIAQAKINPDAAARFLEKPEILGFSVGGGQIGMPSIFDPSSSINTAGSFGGGGSSNSSLDSLRDPSVPQLDADAKSRPSLGARSPDESNFTPLSDEARAALRASPEEHAIRLEAQLVNLNVKAVDRGGNPLPALGKRDFQVFEDGIEQDIFYFEPVNAPINLVLLLDLSGSTRENRKVMIETAKRFIDSLGPGDRVAIAGFTSDFTVVADFTSNKNRLKNAVENVKKIQGGTAFYDAMWATFDLLERVKDSREAIVVLTDGVDNSLQAEPDDPKHSFDELLARVAEEDATIYPIYLSQEEDRLLKIRNDPTQPARWLERVERRLKPHVIAHRQIEQLAEESAGRVFVAQGENELGGVYERVAAELRLIYTLAYAPKNDARDGTYRKIKVGVKHEGAVVKTRRGYFAK